MTRNRWLILGAVLLGLVVFVYLVFFCPGTCE
jgi:type II secretory pathway component PulM